MKKILVPTDFSDEATAALHYAHGLAKALEADVHLLHAVMPYGTQVLPIPGVGADQNVGDQGLMPRAIEQIKHKMEALMADPAFADIKMYYTVTVERVAFQIEKYAKEHAIDLIVMGTSGADGLDEMLIGSNTEKVVRRAVCPIIAVKANTPPGKLDHIVFATDGAEKSAKIVQTLQTLQNAFGAKVHLLTVNTASRFNNTRTLRQRLQHFAEQYQLDNYTVNIYNDASEEDGIIYFADELGADLIALVTHGRTGLAHLFRGSVAEGLVNHDQRPVLTFNLRFAQ